MFMRHAGDQPSGMGELINDETAALWPHAALGVMFAEAKRGEIVKARKDFQRWRGVFDGLAISDPQLAVDIELVDGEFFQIRLCLKGKVTIRWQNR